MCDACFVVKEKMSAIFGFQPVYTQILYERKESKDRLKEAPGRSNLFTNKILVGTPYLRVFRVFSEQNHLNGEANSPIQLVPDPFRLRLNTFY